MFSFSRHTISIFNDSTSSVTLDSVTATRDTSALEEEWSVIEYGTSDLVPTDLAGTTIAPGAGVSVDLYFQPRESGERTDLVTITYDGGATFEFTAVGRGRDALSFWDVPTTFEVLQGGAGSDALASGSVGDGAGGVTFSANANQWTDGFSNNVSVTHVNPDGSLGWAREWHEDYDQRSPDPGQNSESGGSADSIDRADGVTYVVGRRSTSSSNSVFQSMVLAIDDVTGDLLWGSAWSPEDVTEPALAWQSSQAYAVDASLADRVIVAGTSFDNAEVLLFALSKADGSLLWSRQLDVTAGSNDRAHALAVDASGTAYLGGITNGRGLLARVDGVDGASPTFVWAQKLETGVGSNVNSVDVDAAGNVYASLDRRGATTQLSVAAFAPDGSVTWSKQFDPYNYGDNNNSYVVRHDGAGGVWFGGRVSQDTLDTTFGEGFVMQLSDADGSWMTGAQYYTGKGAEEVVEHRVKGFDVDASGDLRVLLQSYSVTLNFDHRFGFWYQLMDDPLADLTLGEDPGDGSGLVVDYAFTATDFTASSDFHDPDGAYNGTNEAWVQPLDGAAWQSPPGSILFVPLRDAEGDCPQGDVVLVGLDLP